GSGYIDFGDGSPLNFFSYAGKNGHAYRSIGKVLIDRGEVKKESKSYCGSGWMTISGQYCWRMVSWILLCRWRKTSDCAAVRSHN
ncbi:MltA domain-containing protein, partial [Escherichia coli]|uniref:MltA domain-containing protein n=1 Tax=Escherichia coli TaxID=562 RepID=UPI0035C77927